MNISNTITNTSNNPMHNTHPTLLPNTTTTISSMNNTTISSSPNISSSSSLNNQIVPFEAKITMDPIVHRRAAQGRERLYVAEAVTVQSTVDGGRERVRSALSLATRLLLIGPLNHSVANSNVYQAYNIQILPQNNSNNYNNHIIDHPWVSWTTTARTQRWKYAGNPSLGI